MSQNEPTPTFLLAGAAGMVMILRDMIAKADRGDADEMAATLDAVHQHLALIGGSIATVADMLGCEDEFAAHIKRGRERLVALHASGTLEGRA